MGRKIRVIDASLRTWYVPDIDDNREDPEPFRVLISPISGKDMRQLRSSLKLNATSLENDDIMQAAEQREEALKALIVSQHVHDIEGYIAEHAKTGEVIEPKTGSALVDCVLEAHPDEMYVLTDIYDAVLKSSTLGEDAKKKCSLQSGSQLAETTEGRHGVAHNAGVQSLQTKTGLENNAIVTAVPTSEVSAVSGSLG